MHPVYVPSHSDTVKWLHGVCRTCTEMAAVSRGPSHVTSKTTLQPHAWIFRMCCVQLQPLIQSCIRLKRSGSAWNGTVLRLPLWSAWRSSRDEALTKCSHRIDKSSNKVSLSWISVQHLRTKALPHHCHQQSELLSVCTCDLYASSFWGLLWSSVSSLPHLWNMI